MAKQPFENVVHHLFQIAALAEFKTLHDQELLKRYVEYRDELAFGELVRRYKGLIWHVCWRVLRHHQDVEDAFQATIMTLMRRAKTILSHESIEGWLHRTTFKIASNAKVAHVRRRAREERSAKMQHENYPSPESRWELSEVLDRELTHIPEKYRSPLILCYLEGLTWTEAVQRLGISLESLEWRLKEGRKRLKKRLNKYGMELGSSMLIAGTIPGVQIPDVPHGLVEKTLDMVRIMTLSNGALETAGVSTEVALLTKQALGMTIKMKILLGSLLLSVVALGAGTAKYTGVLHLLLGEQPQEGKPEATNNDAAETKAEKTKRRDLYGDPLPKGALARLGTVRFRPGSGEPDVIFTADGKELFTVRGLNTCLWDRETGKLLHQWSDPFKNGEIILHTTKVSPDGKLRGGVKTPPKDQPGGDNASGPLCIWETATGKVVCQLEIQGIQIQFKGKKKVEVPYIVRPNNWAFSPDGKSVIASYVWGEWFGDKKKGRWMSEAHGRLVLWDIATGQKRWEQKEDAQGEKLSVRLMNCLTISPDGNLVADGGYRREHVKNEKKNFWRRVEEGTLLRDGRTGQPLRALGHAWVPARLSFSPDGRTLLANYEKAGKESNCIYVWDVATSKERWRMSKEQRTYVFHAFSPDGKTVAIENREGFRYMILAEVATGKEIRCQETRCLGESGGLMAFSPDGKVLARAAGPLIRYWDVATGKILPPPPMFGHEAEVRSVAFTADTQSLISIGANRSVHVWDMQTTQKKLTVCKESRLRKERVLYLGSYGEGVATSLDGKIVATKRINYRKSGSLEFPLDETAMSSCISVWDSSTKEELHKISLDDIPKAFFLGAMVFSPDGKFLAATHHASNKVLLWEIATGKRLDFNEGSDPIFSSDGKLLLTQKGGIFSIWEVVTGKKVSTAQTLKTVSDGMRVAISPDWQILATSTWNEPKKIDLYSLYWDHQSVHFGRPRSVTCPPRIKHVTSLALSPNGKMLAWGDEGPDDSKGYTIHVWETATGEERASFTGHKGRISSLSFSPDGRRLASGSDDSTILVWDVTGGQLDDQGRLHPIQLSTQQVKQLWKDLLSTDGVRVGRAVWELIASPQVSIPFFAKHLSPVSADQAAPQRIAKLIVDLDDDQFSVRKKAMVELEKLGAAGEASLQQALTKHPTLEVRRRLQELLAAVEATRQAPPASVVRVLRAIEVLEQIGSRDAQQLLARLSQGAPGIRQTEEARSSLRRLRHSGQR